MFSCVKKCKPIVIGWSVYDSILRILPLILFLFLKLPTWFGIGTAFWRTMSQPSLINNQESYCGIWILTWTLHKQHSVESAYGMEWKVWKEHNSLFRIIQKAFKNKTKPNTPSFIIGLLGRRSPTGQDTSRGNLFLVCALQVDLLTSRTLAALAGALSTCSSLIDWTRVWDGATGGTLKETMGMAWEEGLFKMGICSKEEDMWVDAQDWEPWENMEDLCTGEREVITRWNLWTGQWVDLQRKWQGQGHKSRGSVRLAKNTSGKHGDDTRDHETIPRVRTPTLHGQPQWPISTLNRHSATLIYLTYWSSVAQSGLNQQRPASPWVTMVLSSMLS